MWQQINSNKQKSLFFITLMAILLFFVGFVFGEVFCQDGGFLGLTIALVIWIIICLISYFKGGDIFLAMGNAKKIEHDDFPMLFNVVEEMTLASGLPKIPDIYIINEDQPNAFATGRDTKHAAIAVTTGLLEKLNRDELQGVIAHEIAHIVNRDTMFMLFASITMGTIVYLSDIFLRSLRHSRGNSKNKGAILILALVFAILAPFFAQMLYFIISRKREFLADACAAQFTRYPMGLANALSKISTAHIPIAKCTKAMAAMYIVNPFSIRKEDEKKPNAFVQTFRKIADFYNGIYATHPKTEDRIAILSQMGYADVLEYNKAFESIKHKSIISRKTLDNAETIKIITPEKTE